MPADAPRLQRRLFGLAVSARRPFAGAVLVPVLAGCVAVAQMLVASRLVAGVFPAPVIDPPAVRQLLVSLLALIALRALLAAAAELSAQSLATAVKSSVRSRLVSHLVARGPRRLVGERTGELVTTAMDGVEKLDAYYRRFVPQAAATALVPLIVLAAVTSLDPASAVILAITGPLIPLFMWLLGVVAEARTREQWATLGRLGGRFLDTLQGLPTLTMFGRDREAAASLAEASEAFRARTMGVLRVAFLSGFVLELAASVSTALVAASIGVRLIEGWMPFETGLAVLLLAPEFYLPFRQLGARHHAGMEGVAAAERIFQLMDGEPGEPPAAMPDAVRETRPPIAREKGSDRTFGPPAALVFERVGFTYPGKTTPALADIDLTLRAGRMTALVGRSGAGKSTLAALALRFLEPAEGCLVADGAPIATVSAQAWRRHVSLVPQRARFFDGSVLDNLRIGNPGASLDEVIAAAMHAEAHDFIARLPRGYDTPVGEAAARLSGGEQQRLAIARALLKPASILILDEPTSALDPRTAAAVARSIARLRQDRAVLVIAHRLETVRQADRVVVLEAGRIVEEGSPGELSKAEGSYARLVSAAALEVA